MFIWIIKASKVGMDTCIWDTLLATVSVCDIANGTQCDSLLVRTGTRHGNDSHTLTWLRYERTRKQNRLVHTLSHFYCNLGMMVDKDLNLQKDKDNYKVSFLSDEEYFLGYRIDVPTKCRENHPCFNL